MNDRDDTIGPRVQAPFGAKSVDRALQMATRAPHPTTFLWDEKGKLLGFVTLDGKNVFWGREIGGDLGLTPEMVAGEKVLS